MLCLVGDLGSLLCGFWQERSNLHSTDLGALQFANGKGPSSDAPSNSRGSTYKAGISSFFKSMFDTCRDARAYSHESREFTKEAHRIQNAD